MNDEETESAKRMAKWGDSGERDAANHHVRWEDTDDTDNTDNGLVTYMIVTFLIIMIGQLFS